MSIKLITLFFCVVLLVEQAVSDCNEIDKKYSDSKATAKVKIGPATGKTVCGSILFYNKCKDDGSCVVQLKGEVRNLTPGYHGFHIHEKGTVDNDCKNSGSHFNPKNVNHGSPTDKTRHVGDLGNIMADANGTAVINFNDTVITLSDKDKDNDIDNRTVVIHAGKDDLGVNTSDSGSISTGNAGSRVACGIVHLMEANNSAVALSFNFLFVFASFLIISLFLK